MSKRLDLVGQKFGRLTVVKFSHVRDSRTYWLCKCDCGTEVIVLGGSLRSGRTKSCGCYRKEKTIERHRLDLVGERFGRLIVIKYDGKDKYGKSLFLCKCDCGNEKVVRGSELTNGDTKSCGCYRRERGRIQRNEFNKNNIGENHPNYKHGLSGTKAYKTQHSAKYNAKKENQTPSDADLEKITYIYQVCESMNQTSRENYEVDHIKPISKGGLHHQDNLQILEKILNNKKRAKITNEYKGITLKDLEKNVGNKNEFLEY